VRTRLEGLVERGFVETDDQLGVEATTLGRLASKYYLRLETAADFRELCERDRITDDAILETVAGAAEFHSVSARQSELDAVTSVLTGTETNLEGGPRKVLAILEASMADSVPADLRSDAWVIRQNALRLLAALREFLDSFAGPRAANLASRVEARVENGVDRDAVGLTAIDGVGSARASSLAAAGIESPAAVVDADVTDLAGVGLSEGVAERLADSARDLPRTDVEWGAFPATVARGENEMCDVTVHNRGGGARVGIRVTVNGVEMSEKTTYLSDQTTVPVGVFGAADDELTYEVEVWYPDLPLLPERDRRVVRVA
jgi:replicative superfamily II helicase